MRIVFGSCRLIFRCVPSVFSATVLRSEDLALRYSTRVEVKMSVECRGTNEEFYLTSTDSKRAKSMDEGRSQQVRSVLLCTKYAFDQCE
jgi:hypothetical protein